MCDHSWSVAGLWPAADPSPVDGAARGCSMPLLLVCKLCADRRKIACGSTRASRCESCAAVYRQRVARVAGSGMVVGVDGLFLTLTAPGTRPHVRPDGEWCKCTRPETELDEWNAGASRRWNRLWQALARLLDAVEVTYDESGARRERYTLDYFRATEVQRRGALHYHVILRRRDGRPLALSKAELRRLAMGLGFGHSVDVQAMQPGHATYVAKYVAKAADERRDVPWRDDRARHHRPRGLYGVRLARDADGEWVWVRIGTGEIAAAAPIVAHIFRRATYRTWSKSAHYGRGMAEIKASQQHFLLTFAEMPDWRNGDRAGGAPSALLCSRLVGVPTRPDVGLQGGA